MNLREKIAYLIYHFDGTVPAPSRCRDKYLELTDAVLLLVLATPDDEVADAIGAAIPSAWP